MFLLCLGIKVLTTGDPSPTTPRRNGRRRPKDLGGRVPTPNVTSVLGGRGPGKVIGSPRRERGPRGTVTVETVPVLVVLEQTFAAQTRRPHTPTGRPGHEPGLVGL